MPVNNEERKPLSASEQKKLDKQRKNAVKQAQKYRKEQNKKAKETSPEKQNKNAEKKSHSKIEEYVNSQPKKKEENLSREEKFRKEGKRKIRNLKPKDFTDGYYVDEFGEKQRQERRAKEIQKQEEEVIKRSKKPLTHKQIKYRRLAVYGAIIAVVIIIGMILSLTVLFKTEKILVEGDEYYYDEQIIAFCGVEYQQNIFIAALTGTPELIEKNLPYVEEASVHFVIPDTVTIKIKDAVPSYVIKNGEKFLVVSSKGRILEEITENNKNYAQLTCEQLKSTKIGDYVAFDDKNIPDILENIATSFVKNKVKKITAIDVSSTASIKFVYDNRITVVLGMPDDIDYKIRTAMAIINDKLDPNKTEMVAGTLDVSNCKTTKTSRYKPAETTIPPETTLPVETTISTDDSLWYTEETTLYTEYETTLPDGYYSTEATTEPIEEVTESWYYTDATEAYTDSYVITDNNLEYNQW